ncbi:hypothetical protein GCM10027432_09820 [Lysobacter fragariae]
MPLARISAPTDHISPFRRDLAGVRARIANARQHGAGTGFDMNSIRAYPAAGTASSGSRLAGLTVG